jgi:hypothetical protein
MNGTETDASVGINVDDHCHTCTVHSTGLLFCSFTDIVCSVITVQRAFRRKKNIIISNQTVTSRTTALYGHCTCSMKIPPPKFSTSQHGKSVKLAVPDFFSKFPCVRVDQ